jgi:hypothetical protein
MGVYKPTMSVTIESEVLAGVKEAARAEGRTISGYVTHALKTYLAFQSATGR